MADHLTRAWDVFISYASEDQDWADNVRSTLEDSGIRCWIASRDVPIGSNWAEEILKGIDAAKAMVLVFSTAANKSKHVKREVNRAVEMNISIFALRVEDVRAEGAVAYAIDSEQWVNQTAPPRKQDFDRLVAAVTGAIQADLHGPAPSVAPSPPGDAVSKRATRVRLLTSAAAVLVVSVMSFAIYLFAVQAGLDTASKHGDRKDGLDEYTNSLGMKLRRIPAGRFVMGSPIEEQGRRPDEDQQEIEIPNDFFLGTYEVTQQEYLTVTSVNPSGYPGPFDPLLPVRNVTWTDASRFCEKLNELDVRRPAGHKYRLPTEAEWEYGCRAGEPGPFSCGQTLTHRNARFKSPDTGPAANSPVSGSDRSVKVERPTIVLTRSEDGARLQLKSKAFLTDVLVSNEQVLNVKPDPADPSTLVLRGLQPGLCRLDLTGVDNSRETFDVIVQHDVELLRMILKRAFPTAEIEILPLKAGAVLSGTVERVDDVGKVLSVVRNQLGCRDDDIVNSIKVRTDEGPCRVGQYDKNRLGLFDMHGNVAEWCLEWYDRQYQTNNRNLEPEVRDKGIDDWHTVRGGSWKSAAEFCRSAARDRSVIGNDRDQIGFRVALVRVR